MLFICLALFAVLARALPPVISRISSGGAAAPNQTIVLAGVGLAGAHARLCPLAAGAAAPCLALPAIASSWDGGLKFTLPADATAIGAFAVSACSAAGHFYQPLERRLRRRRADAHAAGARARDAVRQPQHL